MASKAFNQNASAGFIELFTLQMRLAQRGEKTVLLSLGKRSNKMKLLSTIKQLVEMKYKIYATYKTHKFLQVNDIEAILVHKISQPHKQPNLRDLLDANRFDLIINIPTKAEESEKETTDGQTIRQMSVKNNAKLVTSVAVAKDFVEKLRATKVN
jgi:AICAR transformylase/IMP cyclohydrolase PurH